MYRCNGPTPRRDSWSEELSRQRMHMFRRTRASRPTGNLNYKVPRVISSEKTCTLLQIFQNLAFTRIGKISAGEEYFPDATSNGQ